MRKTLRQRSEYLLGDRPWLMEDIVLHTQQSHLLMLCSDTILISAYRYHIVLGTDIWIVLEEYPSANTLRAGKGNPSNIYLPTETSRHSRTVMPPIRLLSTQ